MSIFKYITKTFKLSLLKVAIFLLALLIICSLMNINLLPNSVEGFSNDSIEMKNFIHQYINLLEGDVVSLCESSSDGSTGNSILDNYITYLDSIIPTWRDNVCFETFSNQDQPEILHNITSENEWRTFLDVYFEDILTSQPRGCAYLNELKLELENIGINNNEDVDELFNGGDRIREMGGNGTMGSWSYLMELLVFANNDKPDSFQHWLMNSVYTDKCDGYDSFHREHSDIDEEIIRIEEWWGDSDHSAMDLDNNGIIDVEDLLIELKDNHDHVGDP